MSNRESRKRSRPEPAIARPEDMLLDGGERHTAHTQAHIEDTAHLQFYCVALVTVARRDCHALRQEQAMLTTMTISSPLGALRLYGDSDELVGIDLPGTDATAGVEQRSDVLVRTAEQLAEYFAGKRQAFDLPLAPRGTGFQTLVWRTLLRIPFGATWSYGELARAIRRPAASRAVGAANGRNPIPIIVPCHRVIGSNGSLTGYGGGLPVKRWLLDHERGWRQPSLLGIRDRHRAAGEEC